MEQLTAWERGGICVLEEVIFELSRTSSGKKVEDKRSRHLIFIIDFFFKAIMLKMVTSPSVSHYFRVLWNFISYRDDSDRMCIEA